MEKLMKMLGVEIEEEVKPPNYQFLTTYNQDYIKRQIGEKKDYTATQEFKDPLSEGFKKYLVIDQKNVESPSQDGDEYLVKVKDKRKKIGEMYFQDPLDHIIIKGDKIMDGKTVYEVDYCDIEEVIRQNLTEGAKTEKVLPDDWIIPETTQQRDFRRPSLLCKGAMEKPLIVIPENNLGQNEKVNQILNVKTGDSEYNQTIGKLGEFIVVRQIHGDIDHPKCTCLQHNTRTY
ncbi:unnamed protein product [Callosobruchus maculatus]|uniref:Uncharacterized protein n=1 Tax=Callosobruchus maculatus TaxID=64391 RepID=A0A653BZZ7_CALMS|nr:unnamed protein product [Callosobruchus maculatus]